MNLFRALAYFHDLHSCYQESFDKIHKALTIADTCHEIFNVSIILRAAKYSENVISVTYSE